MKHGRSAYNRGCRCPECREAARAYEVTRRARPLQPSDHGKVRTYTHRGCRCDACTAVGRPVLEASYARWRGKVPDENGHGKRTTYQLGCRCGSCGQAQREYGLGWREQVRTRPVPANVHGRSVGYGAYKCRCDRCSAYAAARSKAFKSRRRAKRPTFLDSLTVDMIRRAA